MAARISGFSGNRVDGHAADTERRFTLQVNGHQFPLKRRVAERNQKKIIFSPWLIRAVKAMPGDEIARESTMRQSSPSPALLLPFGSLMGNVPVDAMPRGRVLGDPGQVLDRAHAVGSRDVTAIAGPVPAST